MKRRLSALAVLLATAVGDAKSEDPEDPDVPLRAELGWILSA